MCLDIFNNRLRFMKYQPNNLFIGNNRATDHIIGSFLKKFLKSQGRLRGTWS